MTTSMSASSLICSSSSGAPGSPYRSSGSLNGLTSRPSLNKELVQKLRSMTETIKILSDENAVVREENQRLRNSSLPRDVESDNYDELSKSQLVALTISYDKKFKNMADELEKMKEASTEIQMNKNNISNTNKGEKDKYKSLARRLKEERNNYKCALEEKQNEQSVLKDEMEKMSDLISELRENCHKLQSELLQVRRRSASTCERFSDASVQTDHRRTSSARRSSVGSGGSSESVRRARSVYSVSRNNQPSRNPGPSNPKPRPPMNFRNQTATSAAKSVSKSPLSQRPSTPKSGPKFAKPVTKPSPGLKAAAQGGESPLKKGNSPSPSKIPIVRGIPRLGGSSKIPTPSKIPGPKSSPLAKPVSHGAAPIRPPGGKNAVMKDKGEEEGTAGIVSATPAIVSDEIDEEEDILVINKDETIQEYNVSLIKKGEKNEEGPKLIGLSSGSSSSYSSKDEDEAEEEFDDEYTRNSDAKDPSADDEGSRDSSVINSVPCTPKTKKKIENLKQSLAARRVHRTWQHFYEELEERNLPSPSHINLKPQAEGHKTLIKDEKQNRKYSLPIVDSNRPMENVLGEAISSCRSSGISSQFEDDLEEAAHQLRNNYTLKNRIHTARPWLKNKAKSAKELLLPPPPPQSSSPHQSGDGSSEEESHPPSSFPSGSNKANKAYLRLQADKDLFTAGKVSAIKAQFNERRRLPDRSDGITDDDDDMGI